MAIRSIRDVAAAVRGRRLDLGLSQVELATRAGVSRKWVYEFEAGKPSAEFGLALRVFEELGLAFKLDASPGSSTVDSDEAPVDLDALLATYRTGAKGIDD